MATEVTYSVTNGRPLSMGFGTTAVDIINQGSPVRCGNYFSFHAALVSMGQSNSSSPSAAKNKLTVLIAVQDLLAGGSKTRLLCKLKVEYNHHNYNNCSSTTGTWTTVPMPLVSPAKGSIISFPLPMPNSLTSVDSVTPTKVTLSVEPLGDSHETGRPTPTEFQKARSESMLATIDDANLCDASLLPTGTNGTCIRVSRAILAHASPYFKTMFNGTWAELAAGKRDTPIDFAWTATAVLPCLMHMYSGWVPGDGVPECKELREVLDKHAVDTQRLSLHQLLELVDLAETLELPLLVHATYQIMAKRLDRKVKSSSATASKLNQRTNVAEGVEVDKASDVEE